MTDRRVVASWSGGVDSTAVIANLLKQGYEVHAVSLLFGGQKFQERERRARAQLLPLLEALGTITHKEKDASWLWQFSPDGKEIPRRNKHIMDHLITTEMMPRGITNLAMGEYLGADTWLVRDHVSGGDADVRALFAYLYLEYGLSVRLFTLQDFGESRYKKDRMKLGWNVLGEGMWLTTNCLHDVAVPCGVCYKCVERRAAFIVAGFPDASYYAHNPSDNERLPLYIRQMRGESVESKTAGHL